MALSKPRDVLYTIFSAYFEQLYTNPVKTKAITSCIIAALGNILSQKLSGAKSINEDNIAAFALFGLFFGGPLPHYFHTYIRLLVRNPLGILLVERLIYTPCFQALSLYMLSIFEGKNHQAAYKNMQKLYIPLLVSNLKYLTLFQYLNIRYIPPMFRALTTNLIGFAWIVYVATKRARAAKNKQP